ncbi:hypothetical protein EP7_003041 [Isosphaeraceae bacterium EP7]
MLLRLLENRHLDEQAVGQYLSQGNLVSKAACELYIVDILRRKRGRVVEI